MAKEDPEFEAIKRLLKSLQDPRATVFTFLLEAHKPVSKTQIGRLTSLPDWTRDRALEFLYRGGLVEKLQSVTSSNGKETFYFAVLQ